MVNAGWPHKIRKTALKRITKALSFTFPLRSFNALIKNLLNDNEKITANFYGNPLRKIAANNQSQLHAQIIHAQRQSSLPIRNITNVEKYANILATMETRRNRSPHEEIANMTAN